MPQQHRTRWIISLTTVAAGLAACVHQNTAVRSGIASADSRWAGVFLTATDYRTESPAAKIACSSASQPIDRQSFAHSATVQVGDPRLGSAIRYPKDSVFGFRACDGTTVRFVAGENYQLVQESPLYLYDVQRTVDVGKGREQVHDFFFSVAADDSIRPLTRAALKHAYSTNRKFRDLLDLNFRTDEELTQFDGGKNEFKVALILRECLQ